MPTSLIVLHLALMASAVVLLTLICSTGNFDKLRPAALWICLDLMVAVAGVAFCGHPEYGLLIPRLAAFHFTSLCVCLIWMGADAWRGVHPLSTIFAFAFAAYGASRLLQFLMYRWGVGGPWTLEMINAGVYLSVVALLVAALLLPVPPSTQPAAELPCISPVSQMPCPGLAAEAQR